MATVKPPAHRVVLRLHRQCPLPTHFGPSTRRAFNGSFQGTTAVCVVVSAGKYSAFADIGAGRILRQQFGGLLTVAASSSRTAASCISELTLPTLNGRWNFRRPRGPLLDTTRHPFPLP